MEHILSSTLLPDVAALLSRVQGLASPGQENMLAVSAMRAVLAGIVFLWSTRKLDEIMLLALVLVVSGVGFALLADDILADPMGAAVLATFDAQVVYVRETVEDMDGLVAALGVPEGTFSLLVACAGLAGLSSTVKAQRMPLLFSWTAYVILFTALVPGMVAPSSGLGAVVYVLLVVSAFAGPLACAPVAVFVLADAIFVLARSALVGAGPTVNDASVAALFAIAMSFTSDLVVCKGLTIMERSAALGFLGFGLLTLIELFTEIVAPLLGQYHRGAHAASPPLASSSGSVRLSWSETLARTRTAHGLDFAKHVAVDLPAVLCSIWCFGMCARIVSSRQVSRTRAVQTMSAALAVGAALLLLAAHGGEQPAAALELLNQPRFTAVLAAIAFLSLESIQVRERGATLCNDMVGAWYLTGAFDAIIRNKRARSAHTRHSHIRHRLQAQERERQVQRQQAKEEARRKQEEQDAADESMLEGLRDPGEDAEAEAQAQAPASAGGGKPNGALPQPPAALPRPAIQPTPSKGMAALVESSTTPRVASPAMTFARQFLVNGEIDLNNPSLDMEGRWRIVEELQQDAEVARNRYQMFKHKVFQQQAIASGIVGVDDESSRASSNASHKVTELQERCRVAAEKFETKDKLWRDTNRKLIEMEKALEAKSGGQ